MHRMKFHAFICLFCFCYRIILASSPKLIYADRRDIRILSNSNQKGRNVSVVIGGLEDAIALDFYYDRGLVFWTDVSQEVIKRTYVYNGRRSENIVSTGLIRPEGIAFDWVGQNLYWTDSETNRVEVATLDGDFRKVLFWRDLDQPRAIAVNPRNGYMYWTDWGGFPKIERAGMDGSNRSVLVSSEINWPNGLAIDLKDNKLFWTDAKLGYIASINFDGTNRRSILKGSLPHPFAITVFRNRLYWTDWTTRSIHSCNKNSGDNMQIVKSQVRSPMDIHVFESGRQPDTEVPSQCSRNKGGCSHLCLISPVGSTCACPTGVKLLADGKTCENGPLHFLLLARRTDLRRISLDTPDHTPVVLPFKNIRHATAVDYDPVEEFVYWTDTEVGNIRRAKMDGSEVEVIISTEVINPDGIAVDWVARNLYWTDSGTDRIEVCHLNGTSRKVLISEGLSEPRAIVVDPSEGYMYWTDWGVLPKIERAELNGGNRTVLVNSSLGWPNGLAIDYKDRKIFWCDAKEDTIEMINMDGTGRKTVIDDKLPHVFGFSIMDDYIYWTDWQRRSIERINKNGQKREVIVEQLPDLMGLKAVSRKQTYGTNACAVQNGGCSHLCLYRPSGVHCDCPMGLELLSNRKTCIVPEAFLLFSQRSDIRRISLETNNGDRPIPLSGIKEANALDFHIADGRIYWTDLVLKTISRAFMNGTNLEHVIIVDLLTPDGLAVDWVAGNLFWTDSTTHRIEVSRLDGQHRKTLIWKDILEPKAIALNPSEGYMYWTHWGDDPKIEYSFMDGSHRTNLITGLGRPNGLTIDYDERLIFWVDSHTASIECANLEGGDRRKVIGEALPHPCGLTQFKDFIYWTDWNDEIIERANKTNGLNRTRIQNNVEYIMDILVFHSSRQSGLSACAVNNSGCSHLCLALSNQTCACACPTHYRLTEDNKTCQAPEAFLLYSSMTQIRRVVFDSEDNQDVILPLPRLGNIKSLDYNIETEIIYWIDGAANAIRSGFENGTVLSTVVSEDGISPRDLAVDPYSNQLFWTDAESNEIKVTHLTKGFTGVVVSLENKRPRAIVLDSESGRMYWTNISPNQSSIEQSSMDGSTGQYPLVTDDLGVPGDLAIDTQGKRLYWTDSQRKRIESSNLNGMDRIVVVDQNIFQPSGLAIYDVYLYWIDHHVQTVNRVEKIRGTQRQIFQGEIMDLSDVIAVDRRRRSLSHPCSTNNGGCSHICHIGDDKKPKCSCPMNMVLNEDLVSCGEPPTCSSENFKCVSGTVSCIHIAWRCDGRPECKDNSDEIDCPTCQPDQFTCKSGQCVPEHTKCNGEPDCSDGSDEKDCATCAPNKFTCKNGHCISLRWQCDGLDDCSDNSDEQEDECAMLGNSSYPAVVEPFRRSSEISTKMVGGIVAAFVFCLLFVIIFRWMWKRVKTGNDSRVPLEIGLVVTSTTNIPGTPSIHGSNNSCGQVHIAGSKRAKTPCAVVTTSSKSSSTQTVYDRNHLTGASSPSASTVISAYPREPLNPPPSPATERSQFTIRYYGSPPPSTCTSCKHYRAHMPPPPTPVTTDVESSAEHYRRKPRCQSIYSASTCTELAYDSDIYAPPPTPCTNYLSEATHYSDHECPPSPTITERSYFHPYPPPPSPVTDAPSIV